MFHPRVEFSLRQSFGSKLVSVVKGAIGKTVIASLQRVVGSFAQVQMNVQRPDDQDPQSRKRRGSKGNEPMTRPVPKRE